MAMFKPKLNTPYKKIYVPVAPYDVDFITDFREEIVNVIEYRFHKHDRKKYDYYMDDLNHTFINPRDTRAIISFLRRVAEEINNEP